MDNLKEIIHGLEEETVSNLIARLREIEVKHGSNTKLIFLSDVYHFVNVFIEEPAK